MSARRRIDLPANPPELVVDYGRADNCLCDGPCRCSMTPRVAAGG